LDVQQRTDIALKYDEDAEVYLTSYDLDVTAMITDALAEAASFCHRERYGFDEAEVTEVFDGRLVLQVSHSPVISVSELTWDDTELTEDDDFVVYDRYIEIYGLSRSGLKSYEPESIERKVVSVTYTGGYSDSGGSSRAIPKSLASIIREMVVRELLRIDERYRAMNGVQRARIGVSSYDFTPDNELLSDLYSRLARGAWEVTAIA